jgi:hypothetical protein
VHACVYVWMCVYACMHACVYMFACVYVCLCMCVHSHACVCVRVCVCVCVWEREREREGEREREREWAQNGHPSLGLFWSWRLVKQHGLILNVILHHIVWLWDFGNISMNKAKQKQRMLNWSAQNIPAVLSQDVAGFSTIWRPGFCCFWSHKMIQDEQAGRNLESWVRHATVGHAA